MSQPAVFGRRSGYGAGRIPTKSVTVATVPVRHVSGRDSAARRVRAALSVSRGLDDQASAVSSSRPRAREASSGIPGPIVVDIVALVM